MKSGPIAHRPDRKFPENRPDHVIVKECSREEFLSAIAREQGFLLEDITEVSMPVSESLIITFDSPGIDAEEKCRLGWDEILQATRHFAPMDLDYPASYLEEKEDRTTLLMEFITPEERRNNQKVKELKYLNELGEIVFSAFILILIASGFACIFGLPF